MTTYPNDGSCSVTNNTATTLFNGAMPTGGYRIDNISSFATLWISEIGPAAPGAAGSFPIAAYIPMAQGQSSVPSCYETPEGYRPCGPISVYAQVPTTGNNAPASTPITARKWER